MSTPIRFELNGRAREVSVDDPQMPLLYVLRNSFDQRGPRYGCGLGQCGACTVHVDGEATRSCLLPVSAASGRRVTTLDGLAATAGPNRTMHALQQAFIDEQAVQCGYCVNGMIMEAASFLQKNRKPSADDVRNALAANLCRCGTQTRIVRAVLRAAAALA